MYQLRSEETGISNVLSIREALLVAEKDKSIWKISFNSESGERIRLVRVDDMWIMELFPVLNVN